MKQYVIDELRLEDYEKVKEYFNTNCKPASIEGVYWLEIPGDILSETQMGHDACKPFNFALELDENSLACGLLVRASSNIRCHCIAYASLEQRNWLIDTIDSIMEKIGVVI